jgi:hypothetical protein
MGRVEVVWVGLLALASGTEAACEWTGPSGKHYDFEYVESVSNLSPLSPTLSRTISSGSIVECCQERV